MLCDTVPKMIVVAEGPDEIARLRLSVPGVYEFFLRSANEGVLAARVNEMMALADSATGGCVPVPSVLCLEDSKLDFRAHVFVTPNWIFPLVKLWRDTRWMGHCVCGSLGSGSGSTSRRYGPMAKKRSPHMDADVPNIGSRDLPQSRS